VGIVRAKPRFGKHLIKIFADHCRLDDRPTVVDQRRHDAVRIRRQVFRTQRLARPQIDLAASIGESFSSRTNRTFWPQTALKLSYRTGEDRTAVPF